MALENVPHTRVTVIFYIFDVEKILFQAQYIHVGFKQLGIPKFKAMKMQMQFKVVLYAFVICATALHSIFTSELSTFFVVTATNGPKFVLSLLGPLLILSALTDFFLVRPFDVDSL